MKQQSPVDYIFGQLPDEYTTTPYGFDVYIIAKAMERERIEDAFQEGKWDWAEHIVNDVESKDASQYYNETFNTNEE